MRARERERDSENERKSIHIHYRWVEKLCHRRQPYVYFCFGHLSYFYIMCTINNTQRMRRKWRRSRIYDQRKINSPNNKIHLKYINFYCWCFVCCLYFQISYAIPFILHAYMISASLSLAMVNISIDVSIRFVSLDTVIMLEIEHCILSLNQCDKHEHFGINLNMVLLFSFFSFSQTLKIPRFEIFWNRRASFESVWLYVYLCNNFSHASQTSENNLEVFSNFLALWIKQIEKKVTTMQ